MGMISHVDLFYNSKYHSWALLIEHSDQGFESVVPKKNIKNSICSVDKECI